MQHEAAVTSFVPRVFCEGSDADNFISWTKQEKYHLAIFSKYFSILEMTALSPAVHLGFASHTSISSTGGSIGTDN